MQNLAFPNAELRVPKCKTPQNPFLYFQIWILAKEHAFP